MRAQLGHVDTQLLDSLVRASANAHGPRFSSTLDRVVVDDATWGRLIEMACESRADVRGRIPPDMTEPCSQSSTARAFPTLAQTFQFLGANRRYTEWAAMPVPLRRAAALTALRYVSG